MVPQSSVDNGTWKYDVFAERSIEEVMNSSALEGVFGHLEDLDNRKTKEFTLVPEGTEAAMTK